MPQIIQQQLQYGPKYANEQLDQGMRQLAAFTSIQNQAASDRARLALLKDRNDLDRSQVERANRREDEARDATGRLDALAVEMAKLGKRPKQPQSRPGFAPGIGELPAGDLRQNLLVRRWDAQSDQLLQQGLRDLSVLPPEQAQAFRAQLMNHAAERGNVNDLVALKARAEELAASGHMMGATVDPMGQLMAQPDPEIEGGYEQLMGDIEAGVLDANKGEQALSALLGEATRRRSNAANIAQRVQMYEAQLAQQREQTKRPLRYASELLDALKLTMPGSSDEELKQKFQKFDSEILQAMRGNAPVQDENGRTFYLDEAQVDGFKDFQEKMRAQERDMGVARLDLLRQQMEAANKDLVGEYQLGRPSEYITAAARAMGELAEWPDVMATAQQMMEADARDILRRKAEKNPRAAGETPAAPEQPTGPREFSALGEDEKASFVQEYNSVLRERGPLAAVQLAKSKGVNVLSAVRGDGSLPSGGKKNHIEDTLKNIEDAERHAQAVVAQPELYTVEEVAAARGDKSKVRQDKMRLARVQRLVKAYNAETEDGWMLAINQLPDHQKKKAMYGQVENYGDELELLTWFGDQNGWKYSPEAAREAAARLRAKK